MCPLFFQCFINLAAYFSSLSLNVCNSAHILVCCLSLDVLSLFSFSLADTLYCPLFFCSFLLLQDMERLIKCSAYSILHMTARKQEGYNVAWCMIFLEQVHN